MKNLCRNLALILAVTLPILPARGQHLHFNLEDFDQFGLLRKRSEILVQRLNLAYTNGQLGVNETALFLKQMAFFEGDFLFVKIPKKGPVKLTRPSLFQTISYLLDGFGVGDVIDNSSANAQLDRIYAEMGKLDKSILSPLPVPELAEFYYITYTEEAKDEARLFLDRYESLDKALERAYVDLQNLNETLIEQRELLSSFNAEVQGTRLLSDSVKTEMASKIGETLGRIDLLSHRVFGRIRPVAERRQELNALIHALRNAIGNSSIGSTWHSGGYLVNSNVDEFYLSFDGTSFTHPTTEIRGSIYLGELVIRNLVSGIRGTQSYTARISLTRMVQLPGATAPHGTQDEVDLNFSYRATPNSTGDPVKDADYLDIPVLGVSMSIPENSSMGFHVYGAYNSPLAIVAVVPFDLQTGLPTEEAPELPAPVVSVEHAGNSNGGSRYSVRVSNVEAYSPALFTPAPDLPPCGLNTSASRTWVEIETPTGQYLNGFCAFSSPESLRDLWFSVPENGVAPAGVRIALLDRQTGRKVYSDLAELPEPRSISFQPDLAIARGTSPAGASGGDVYETMARPTSLSGLIRGRRTSVFSVSVQNDGLGVDAIGVRSTQSNSKRFSTSAFHRGRNVAAAMRTGSFATGKLEPDAVEQVLVKIKGRGERGQTSYHLAASSGTFPWRTDWSRATVKSTSRPKR
jgi:hypothetical protein